MEQLDITIHKRASHPLFPSGSGVEFWNGNYYGVGDDSPYLFKINPQFEILEKILIKDFPAAENGRIPKSEKPDFEAMALTEWKGKELSFIVGSGSKSPTRDKGYFIDMHTKIAIECSLTELYQSMIEQAHFSEGEELNIEGLAISSDSVYFANRGNSGSNMIFIFPKEKLFNHFLENSSELPQAEIVKITLPSIDSYEAGLSGIVHVPKTNEFAFTASVEATDNAYEDGEILGSFVGLISESQIRKAVGTTLNISELCTKLSENSENCITKVESIVVTEVNDDSYEALLVSDNDNGPSELFTISIDKVII